MAGVQKDEESEANYHHGEGQGIQDKHTHMYVPDVNWMEMTRSLDEHSSHRSFLYFNLEMLDWNIEALPSMTPQKKYCDITGLEVCFLK